MGLIVYGIVHTKVDVEQSAIGSFDEEDLAGLPLLVEESNCVLDQIELLQLVPECLK